jgi:D-alanyl-D-alanine carboxypeptidase
MKRHSRGGDWFLVLGMLLASILGACGRRPSPQPTATLSAVLPAAQVAGTWDVTLVGPGGSVLQGITLTLQQQNGDVNGSWVNASVPEPRTVEGTVRGNQIELIFAYQEQGEDRRFAISGTVTQDRMEGTATIQQVDGAEIAQLQWSAVRAAIPPMPQVTPEARAGLRMANVPPDELGRRFQAALDSVQAEEDVPGAVAALVLPDGQSFVAASGLADVEAGTPMPVDARMLAGSVGKTFTAATVLSLVAEGKLGLDDRIGLYLGDREWFDRLPNASGITIRMLLNHSSGITDYATDPAFEAAVREQAQQPDRDPDFHLTPEELVAFALDKAPLYPPGQGYAYSSTGYILLGLIIEKVAGTTYYELLRARFLDPLDLVQTGPANRRDLPGLVPGYLPEDNPLGLPVKTVENGEMIFSPATEWTDGGLISNAADLARWAWLLYRGNAMKADYLEEMVGSASAANPNYGLGVSISDTSLGLTYGHTGEFPGYHSKIAYYPDYQIAIAVQVNTGAGVDTGRYVTQLARSLLSEP